MVRENIQKARENFSIRSIKAQLILLFSIYTLWIVTTWPQTLTYHRLCMDSYGALQYVYPLFWVILAFCIIFLLFSNAHPSIKLSYCVMLGLMTFGTLALILQLGTHHDSVPNLNAAIGYIENAFIDVGSDPRNSFPLVYILWGILIEFCDISLESLLKYHAILITVLYIASGLLLSKWFFPKQRASEYSTYFLIFIFTFGSRFTIRLNPAPQTLGIILTIFILALIFKPGVKYRVMQILLFTSLCLSHAISSYYLICLLLAILITQLIIYLKTKNRIFIQHLHYKIKTLALMIVIFLSWFLYVSVFTSNAALSIARQISEILFQNSSDTVVSALPNLYQSGNLPMEYFITNRFGWFVLVFITILGTFTIALTIKKREYTIGLTISSMVSTILILFYLSSIRTNYGLLLDRAFLFMVIPAGLAFVYLCGELKSRIRSEKKVIRNICVVIFLIIGVMALFTVSLSHYTDNFNSITHTEVKAQEFQGVPLYIEGQQDFNSSVVISQQIVNVRSYLECELNNTVVKLQNAVIVLPKHEFVYNNGNIKYYLANDR